MPKRIYVTDTSLRVRGAKQKDPNFSVSYPHRGNKRDLKISAVIGGNPIGFKVRVVPSKGSMIMTPSSQRRVDVIPDSVSADPGVTFLSIDKQYKLIKGKLQSLDDEEEKKENFSLPDDFTFSGAKRMAGGNSSFLASGTIQYK